MRRTAVSVTPLALEQDSRSLKIARSLARFGYRSIVVEGIASRDPRQFEMPVISLGPAPEPESTAAVLRKRLRGGTGVELVDALIAAAYRARYHRNFGSAVVGRLPPAELYYLHAFTYAPAVSAACGRHGAAYIYDAHDFYPDMQATAEVSNFERQRLNPFLESLEQDCCAHAAAVVTVSEGVGALIRQRFRCAPVIIRNAHDLRTDREPERDVRAAAGLGTEDRLIVVVGNDKPGQATASAIDALAGLPARLHLAFIGTGYDAHRAQVAERSLDRRVHFLSRVPPDAVVPFIAAADAAAILYYSHTADYRHALPNKFFQATAAGLPLLYPTELEEVGRLCASHGFGIAIDPRDSASLSAGFLSVASDAAVVRHEREASRRAGLALSWEAEERRLGELLGTLDRKAPA